MTETTGESGPDMGEAYRLGFAHGKQAEGSDPTHLPGEIRDWPLEKKRAYLRGYQEGFAQKIPEENSAVPEVWFHTALNYLRIPEGRREYDERMRRWMRFVVDSPKAPGRLENETTEEQQGSGTPVENQGRLHSEPIGVYSDLRNAFCQINIDTLSGVLGGLVAAAIIGLIAWGFGVQWSIGDLGARTKDNEKFFEDIRSATSDNTKAIAAQQHNLELLAASMVDLRNSVADLRNTLAEQRLADRDDMRELRQDIRDLVNQAKPKP